MNILSIFKNPFVEQELSSSRKRSLLLALSAVVTLGIAGMNLMHYVDEVDRVNSYKGTDWYYTSIFVDHGIGSMFGNIDLHLMLILGVVLLIVTPALACQRVLQEMTIRSIDAMFITPMSSRELHDGLVTGTLAKMAPLLAAPMLVHVMMPLTGGVDLLTMFLSTALLIFGSLVCTSLGVTLGVMVHRYSPGALVGLGLMAGLTLLMFAPMLWVGEHALEWIQLLSPMTLALGVLGQDSNPWLADLLFQNEDIPLFLLLPGFFLCYGTLGYLLRSISSRKLDDPSTSGLSKVQARVGIGVASFVMIVIAAGMSINSGGATADDFSRAAVGYGVVFFMLMVPLVWALIALMLPTREYIARQAIWSVTRPESVKTMTAHLKPVRNSLIMFGVPALFSGMIVAISVFVSPYQPGAELLVRATLIALPLGWLVAVSIVSLRGWQYSARKPHHHLLLIIVLFGAMFISFYYIDGIMSDNSGHSNNFRLGIPGGVGLSVGFVFLIGLLVLPFVFGAKLRSVIIEHGLNSETRLANCVDNDNAVVHFERWPEPAFPEGTLSLLLSASCSNRRRGQEVWLRLEDDTIALTQHIAGATVASDRITLSRPFSINATLQAGDDTRGRYNPETTSLLNLQLTQRDEALGTFVTLGFAFPVKRAQFVDCLQTQDQNLPILNKRDFEPVLAALRYHTEAGDIALPFATTT